MIHPLTFLKGAGIGAGLMYLFDPDRGNQRRAQIRDQFNSMMHSCESCMDATLRDVENRWQGVTHDMQQVMGHQPADDRTLSERVRATMGRYVSHPRAIAVDVEEGCVCLSGPILADEVQSFVRAVKSVPGVQQVDNQLEVHHSPAGVSALQGGRPRQGARFELMQESWSPATRLLMSGVGAGLVANCLARRTPMAMILGTVGFGLLTRSTSNEPIRRLTGLESAAERATQHARRTGALPTTGETGPRQQTARSTEPTAVGQMSDPDTGEPPSSCEPSVGQQPTSPPT